MGQPFGAVNELITFFAQPNIMNQIEYEFASSLIEINELLSLADEAATNEQVIVKTINKAALILLAAKLENFLENLIDSYVFIINQSNFPRKKLPIHLRYNHFLSKLSPITKEVSPSMEKTEHVCKEVAEFFSHSPTEIVISSKFNYGKHGSKEIEKLMLRIGIQGIFGNFSPINQDIEIDMAADIDSITNIRNNIIHSDADPALSTEQIHSYLFKLDLWASCLVDTLNRELRSILAHE